MSLGFKSQLSESNWLKHNSFLTQILSAKNKISDIEFLVSLNFNINKYTINDFELLLVYLAIKNKMESTIQLYKK